MGREIRDRIRAIEAYLRQWDPIGVIPDLLADGLPPSEYDDYAPHILGLLSRGVGEAELAAHLGRCRTEAMGLAANPVADASTAHALVEW